MTRPHLQVHARDLQGILERRITERTWGRVHRLQVAVLDGRVRVSGYAPSYNAMQLALQAVLDVLGSASRKIELDIDVVDVPTSTASVGFEARKLAP